LTVREIGGSEGGSGNTEWLELGDGQLLEGMDDNEGPAPETNQMAGKIDALGSIPTSGVFGSGEGGGDSSVSI
jgi:hypothetical protein